MTGTWTKETTRKDDGFALREEYELMFLSNQLNKDNLIINGNKFELLVGESICNLVDALGE